MPWHKEAVFYEIPIKSFYDSNGDGIGDLTGLTEKLDYLQHLEVDCLWLLPMYPSPMRDDGYDISDFYDIHPDYGTVADFERFIQAAHERKLRVIADLVLNHTSDQHPWFQAARHPGSPKRDWYVWSDDDQKYKQAPHHLLGHREVELDLGPRRQGLLLAPLLLPSARPQLRQSRGARRDAQGASASGSTAGSTDSAWTPSPISSSARAPRCENLPETHAFFKELRAAIDKDYSGRILLAEANQVPGGGAALFRRGRRVPHGLPLSPDAAHLHRDPQGGPQAHRRRPARDPADPGLLPMGAVPAQPRRADPRDGHRRGAGVPAQGVRP